MSWREQRTHRLEAVRRRVAEMIADPVGGQMLRDLVPRDAKIMSRLPEDDAVIAIVNATLRPGDWPAFIAVERGEDDPLILVARQNADGHVYVHRPGDERGIVVRRTVPAPTLASVVQRLRDEHGEP